VVHPPATRAPITGAEYVEANAERFVDAPGASSVITAVHGVTDRAACFSEEVGGREGGAPAVQRVAVVAVEGGRVVEMHRFPPDHRPAAEARFAELAATPEGGGAAIQPQVENLASRAVRAGNDVALAGNWDAVVEGLDPDVVLADRRPLYGGITAEGAASYREFVRSVFRTGVAHVSVEVQAQRGDHLALVHVVHSGPMASLTTEQVVELDEAGRHIVRHELFEPAQLREAAAVLDDLYAATLGAEDAAAWDVYRRSSPALSAPQAGFETSPESWWMTRRVLGLSRGVVYTWADLRGSREDGTAIAQALHVVVTRDGELSSVDAYAPEDVDVAAAHFTELTR
jgi:hypothetical protein